MKHTPPSIRRFVSKAEGHGHKANALERGGFAAFYDGNGELHRQIVRLPPINLSLSLCLIQRTHLLNFFPVALENPLAFSTALSHELKSGGAVAHRSQPPLSHTFHQLLPAQVIQLNQLEMLYGKHLVDEAT